MADISNPEPPTHGRIVLHTTKGDLDVELWSRECPLACQNFTQHCLEGYFNGTIFHRVIPGFLVQTGDPTGTGSGGESVFGHPFATEVHSRLKFRHRGMLGMAAMGEANMNSSQFFVTLDSQESLTGRSTLFGRVVGSSIYTLNEIADVEIDKHDKPVGSNPPRIIWCEVIENAFPEIVPRTTRPPWSAQIVDNPPLREETKSKLVSTRGSKLSFQDDEDSTDYGRRPPPVKRVVAPISVKVPADAVKARVEEITLPGVASATIAPPNAPTSSESILSEIEKLKRAIQQTSVSPPKPVETSLPKRAKVSEEELMRKFSSWSSSLRRKTDVGSSESDPALGASWLKQIAPVKFAVDSKTAFRQ